MRYSRMLSGPPRRKGKGANLIIVAVILGITAYFIGAGAAGGWLAENVINPVFNTGEGTAGSPPPEETAGTVAAAPSPTQQASQPATVSERREEQITAKSITLYTLQAGAFSSQSNAATAANEITARGGAGYIAYDGNLYRALIAGYTRETDASSVKDELATQGITSSLFKLESGALEFKIGAEQTQIDAVKACFDIVPETVDALQQIIYDADNGQNVDERVAALAAAAEDVTAHLKRVITSENDAMVRLCAYMDGLCKTLSDIPASTSVTKLAFSSSLKYNIIGIVVDYSAFLSDIGG